MRTGLTRVRSPHTGFVRALGANIRDVLSGNLGVALVFCVMMIMLAKGLTNLPGWPDVIASENGPVERMSAAVWFMTTVWCLAAGWKHSGYRIEWLGLTTVCLLFGLRELDAHIWATGWNLDKLANYWNPRFPLWERLLVIGCMIIPTMTVGAVLCSRIWARLEKACENQDPWIGQMTVGGVLLGVCLLLDKLDGEDLSLLGLENARVFFMGMEEFGEYVLGVYTVSVLWPYWQEIFLPKDRGS